MKKRTFIVLAAVVATAGPLAAQTPASGAAPPDARRHAIRMMEAVLSRAVIGGAEHLAEQLASDNPNMSFFTGEARARGFVLDDYGVFFHVEIPEMQSSVVFSITTLERDLSVADALEPLTRVVEAAPDGPAKLHAEQAIRRLQVQFGGTPPAPPPSRAVAPPGAIRSADATTVAERVDPPAEAIPAPILRDPHGAYRDAIKTALIEAMLEHSRGLSIAPGEWLTVAARRGHSPLAPNEIVTSSTLVLRVKGSDLALYDADRSRKDEVRGRVEVREF